MWQYPIKTKGNSFLKSTRSKPNPIIKTLSRRNMVTIEKIINQITYQICAESIKSGRDRPQGRCSRNLSNKKNYDSKEKLMIIVQKQ